MRNERRDGVAPALALVSVCAHARDCVRLGGRMLSSRRHRRMQSASARGRVVGACGAICMHGSQRGGGLKFSLGSDLSRGRRGASRNHVRLPWWFVRADVDA